MVQWTFLKPVIGQNKKKIWPYWPQYGAEEQDAVNRVIKSNQLFAEKEVKKLGLRAPMVGHLGDGNFHIMMPYNPKIDDEYKKIKYFNDILIDKSLELEGTITGEHGIGLHKKSYLLKEHPDNVPLMKSIKRTMDPNNIMNPGKIFDLN